MSYRTGYPEWNRSSFKEWRAEKVSHVKAAIKAVDELRLGCAITPAMDEIVEAHRLLVGARKKMRASEWKG